MRILGVDFTSAPRPRKAITVATGSLRGGHLTVEALADLVSFEAFEALLAEPGPWVGGFDFPFGLPRDFLASDPALPRTWAGSMEWLRDTSRDALRERFRAFCDARPAGSKFAHRATDLVARSSPSMKWVNPPVAWMMKEGAPRLLEAGVHIPRLHDGDRTRVALEAYPALVARTVLGHASYKSDDRAKQTPARTERRARVLESLEVGGYRGVDITVDAATRDGCIADATGDRLDAVLCAVQAAACARRADHGLPPEVDELEGFIAGALVEC